MASTDDITSLLSEADYEGYTLNWKLTFEDAPGEKMIDPATGSSYLTTEFTKTTSAFVKILPCKFESE